MRSSAISMPATAIALRSSSTTPPHRCGGIMYGGRYCDGYGVMADHQRRYPADERPAADPSSAAPDVEIEVAIHPMPPPYPASHVRSAQFSTERPRSPVRELPPGPSTLGNPGSHPINSGRGAATLNGPGRSQPSTTSLAGKHLDRVRRQTLTPFMTPTTANSDLCSQTPVASCAGPGTAADKLRGVLQAGGQRSDRPVGHRVRLE